MEGGVQITKLNIDREIMAIKLCIQKNWAFVE